MMKTGRSYFAFAFKRRFSEKLLGWSFLILYFGVIWWLQTKSKSSSIISFPSWIHAWIILVCAWLNVMSHMAVVMNCLNDGLVISILVGVGFDVASSVLYLCYTHSPWLYLWSIWDLMIHLRALLFFKSVDRMQAVVTSATNNLKGNPGPYYLDHFFAYTDAGKHLLYLGMAIQSCGWKISVSTTLGVVLVLLGGISIVQQAQGNVARSTPMARISVATITTTRNEAKPLCDCGTCRDVTSFSIVPRLCDLWFCTFEELLQKIDQAKKLLSSKSNERPSHLRPLD
jgi:hypothetical protein